MASNRSLSKEEFEERLNYFTNNNFENLEIFTRLDIKMKFRCKRCNTTIDRIPEYLLKNKDKEKCITCKKKNEIISYINTREDYELINIEDIKGNQTFINVKHTECGMKRKVQFAGFKKKRGCPYCKNNLKMDINLLKSKIKEKYGNQFLVIESNYKNNKTPMKFLHTECNKIIETSSNNLLYYGRCPHCSVNSKGEEFIKNYLLEKNIDFLKEYSIQNLKNEKKLRFDFYLPDVDLLIEFDGKQHFLRDEKSFMIREYDRRIKNDRMKNQYCKENNLNLLRISYLEYDNLRLILDAIIKEKSSTTIESLNILFIKNKKIINEDKYYNE